MNIGTMTEENSRAVVLGAGESGVGAALLYQSRGIPVLSEIELAGR